VICAPATGGEGEIWSSKRCAIEASISRSALIRTSAAVARSTTSSLVNSSAPRVLSRRANSCMLIICSLILGLLLIHRNRLGRWFPHRRPGYCGYQRCQLLGGPDLFGEPIAHGGRQGRHTLRNPCWPTARGKVEVRGIRRRPPTLIFGCTWATADHRDPEHSATSAAATSGLTRLPSSRHILLGRFAYRPISSTFSQVTRCWWS
jgi:hypothetical protein